MSKFGVKEDDVSKGKNELATGGGAVNSPRKLYKSVTITAYLTGESVDDINWYAILAPGAEDKYELTKCDVKLYIGQLDNSTR